VEAPVPVTVRLEVAGGTDIDVEIVKVEFSPALIVDGLNDALAATGSPARLNATGWVTPLVTEVLIVNVARWPAVSVTEPGVAPIEKPFGAAAGLNMAMPAAQ
jgi:hypothetical protein